MAQRNIDFGSFPDDPSADAIRTAFQKVQENFTEVFAGLGDQAVSSINKGSTISFIKTNGIYDGIYIIKIVNGMNVQSHKVLIQR